MPARSAFQNQGGLTCIALVKANGETRATQASQCSQLVAPTDRHLLRLRRQGQRPLLRPQTRRRKTVECEPHRRLKLWIYDLPPSSYYGATGRTSKHFTLIENHQSAATSMISSPAGSAA